MGQRFHGVLAQQVGGHVGDEPGEVGVVHGHRVAGVDEELCGGTVGGGDVGRDLLQHRVNGGASLG